MGEAQPIWVSPPGLGAHACGGGLQVDVHPDARLAGLSELYNVLTDAGAQLAVLTELLKYGAAAGRAHLLVPVIQQGADSWPAELHLSPAQTRDLLLLCADVLRSSQVGLTASPVKLQPRFARSEKGSEAGGPDLWRTVAQGLARRRGLSRGGCGGSERVGCLGTLRHAWLKGRMCSVDLFYH